MPRLSRKNFAAIFATVSAFFVPIALFAAGNIGFDGLNLELQKFTKGVVTSTGYMLFTLATVAFFFGIVQFIWSARQGSEGKGITRGKQFMMWGLIGLFVMFSVWGIVKFAQGIFGIQGDNVITVPNLKFNVNGSTDTTSPLSAADYRNASDIQSDNATAARQAAAAKGSSGIGSASGKTASTGGTTPIAPVTTAQKIEAAKDNGAKQSSPAKDIGESCTYEVTDGMILDDCVKGAWCVSGICRQEAGEGDTCYFNDETDSCGSGLSCNEDTNTCVSDSNQSSGGIDDTSSTTSGDFCTENGKYGVLDENEECDTSGDESNVGQPCTDKYGNYGEMDADDNCDTGTVSDCNNYDYETQRCLDDSLADQQNGVAGSNESNVIYDYQSCMEQMGEDPDEVCSSWSTNNIESFRNGW